MTEERRVGRGRVGEMKGGRKKKGDKRGEARGEEEEGVEWGQEED